MIRLRLGVAGLGMAVVAAAVVAVIVAAAQVSADTIVSTPFTWQGETWCPTYRAANGCNDVQQSGSNSSVPSYPAQVTRTGVPDSILLKMNAAATETGAFNTQTYETFSAPATISEQISLPCNVGGQIENWPAFRLVTTGSWPAGGEIDVMEGLHGYAAWHYHYLNSSGASSQAGGAVSGFSGCGRTLIRSTGPRPRSPSTTTARKSVRSPRPRSAYRLLPARCTSSTTTRLPPLRWSNDGQREHAGVQIHALAGLPQVVPGPDSAVGR